MVKQNDSNSSENCISLDVYLKVSGFRSDQTAGFRRWISSYKVGKQTKARWQELWDQFLRRPVK